MFIDSDNFEEQKNTIIEQIKASDFLGFDLELTGIKSEYQDIFEEQPFERFLKGRKVCMKYNIIQFGLCAFIKEQDQYKCYPYTFYLFPQDEDEVIGMQVGAVFFNSNHGMDWNRWINRGINYITKYQYQKLIEEKDKEQLQVDQEQIKNQFNIVLSDAKEIDKPQLNEYFDSIKQFYDSKEKTLTIQTNNSYQRKLIYLYVDAYYPNVFAESGLRGDMILHKLTNEERQIKLDDKKKIKDQLFIKKIGFYQIWDVILQTKKPLIGHNCFADLLFCYSHFVGCPPISWEEFKIDIQLNFPVIYDTKYMITVAKGLDQLRQQLKSEQSSSLETIVEIIKSNIQPIPLIEPKTENQDYHTAGYDAYMTGYIFLYFSKLIDENELKLQEYKLYQFKSNYYLDLNQTQDIKKNIDSSFPLYVKIQEDDKKQVNKQQKVQKKQQQNQQKIIYDLVIDTIKKLNQDLKNSKILHQKYIYLEFSVLQDIKKINSKFQLNPDLKELTILNEQQYTKERKEIKEKEANCEKIYRR